MAKGPSKSSERLKRTREVNQLAHELVRLSTDTPEATEKMQEPTKTDISRVMAALGRRGGKIGGKRRMAKLSEKERSDLAYKAAQARWDKAKKA